MLLPIILALSCSAFCFALTFALIVLSNATAAGAVLIFCAGAAAAAALAMLSSDRWLLMGAAAGGIFVAYLLTVFVSLAMRAELSLWPLAEAALALASAVLAAHLVGRWRRMPAQALPEKNNYV
jgi:hypothetical protein